MGAGLVASYGTLGALMGRFLYPARPTARRWMFVTDVAAIAVGESLTYRLPDGRPVSVTRRGETGAAEDFIALSSTCPHLGCQVHWQPQNNRFFCPCHNGVFTPEGKGIGGPPGEAGQSLPEYPLRVRNGLLYIEVPVDAPVARAASSASQSGQGPGPGHDPGLSGKPRGERGVRA